MTKKVNSAIRYAADRGYTVDQFGNVYGPTSTKLKLFEKRHTRMVYLSFTVGDYKVKVHRFVAFLKFGRRALRKGVHVRHRDNDNFNNAWDNVLLGTQSQNERDKPIELRRRLGATNLNRKAALVPFEPLTTVYGAEPASTEI